MDPTDNNNYQNLYTQFDNLSLSNTSESESHNENTQRSTKTRQRSNTTTEKTKTLSPRIRRDNSDKKIRRKVTKRKSLSNSFKFKTSLFKSLKNNNKKEKNIISEEEYSASISNLYNLYGIDPSNTSREINTIIDICEGSVSKYISNNFGQFSEERNKAYQTYCLGFMHIMQPDECINFINQVFSSDNIPRNKKLILLRFIRRILNTTIEHSGPQYTEWEHKLMNSCNANLDKYHSPKTISINKYTNYETLHDFPDSYSTDYIVGLILNTENEYIVENFSDHLQMAFDYYLAPISEDDFIHFNSKGKEKIEKYSSFESNYLFYICNQLISEHIDNSSNDITIHILKKYIELLCKCCVYTTQNNMQHIGMAIYLFLNTYEIYIHIDQYKEIKNLMAEYQEYLDEHYHLFKHNTGITKSEDSRWPLSLLTKKIARVFETHPIEADKEINKKTATIKLTNEESIYSYGALIDLFIKRVRKVPRENMIIEEIDELDYSHIDTFKTTLEDFHKRAYKQKDNNSE